MARFEEGLEVITRLLKCGEPVTYEGKFFQLREASYYYPVHFDREGLNHDRR